MLILALDTTTRAGSVAVTRDDELLALVDGDASRTHGERLPAEIDEALHRANVERAALDLLVVATGPGAFTGLRIGLAAIQGVSMVTGVPVIGVSALDALALTGQQDARTLLLTWMDAQRGEVFSATYAPGTDVPVPDDDPIVASPAMILAGLSLSARTATFIGDGALRYRAEIDAWSGGLARVIEPTPALAPSLAWIGHRLAARGAAGPPHTLQPLYVRRSDAELERSRRSES